MRASIGALAARPRIQLPAFALPPRLRRRALALLAAAVVLAAAYFFYLRDSSFVQVEHVSVSGLTTDEATQVRQALTASRSIAG